MRQRKTGFSNSQRTRVLTFISLACLWLVVGPVLAGKIKDSAQNCVLSLECDPVFVKLVARKCLDDNAKRC
jgi:hypothetical protein